MPLQSIDTFRTHLASLIFIGHYESSHPTNQNSPSRLEDPSARLVPEDSRDERMSGLMSLSITVMPQRHLVLWGVACVDSVGQDGVWRKYL